jgi:predicted PurR-regulated permease PerM
MDESIRRIGDNGSWARLSDNAHQSGAFAFAVSRIGGVVLTTATAVRALIIICIVSVYFAAEPETYLEGLRFITPLRYQNVVELCLTSAATQLRWWLLAKFVSMLSPMIR